MSSNLRQRSVTAVALVLVFLCLDLLAHFTLAGRLLLAMVGTAVVALCSFEVAAFTFKNSSRQRAAATMLLAAPAVFSLLGALRCVSSENVDCRTTGMLLGLSLGTIGLFIHLFVLARTALTQVMGEIISLALGFLLIGLGGSSFVTLALAPSAGALVGWLVLVVSVTDIGAYAVGLTVKGPKLAPAISPGKTISGGIGGLVLGASAGLGAGSLVFPAATGVLGPLGMALLVSIAAQSGDLMKSALKRIWNVKDSGSILPGHGGVLDRVDGHLAGAMIMLALLSTWLISP